MNILAFGASNNMQSINRTLATHAAHLVEGARVKVIDIANYEMPLFSDEREQALGQPLQARSFFEEIASADAIVVSFAEHNGSYTAAYKNLFDWTSRISQKVFQGKPVVYLSASPGPGGAGSVLASAVASAPFFGADVIASLSVPSFQKNFDLEQNQWVNPEIRKALETVMEQLADAVHRDRKAA